jgi:hypothetical protein
LCEAIVGLFKRPDKPTRILYTKGEGLLVERTVPESKVPEDSPFVTPYQMVRQHAEVEIIESGTPAEMLCRAATAMAARDYQATMFIARSRDVVDRWFTDGRVDVILRLPFFEDTDCPEGFLVLAGSQTGVMMAQIEYAVLCRME